MTEARIYIVLLVGATVKSLGGEFLRVIAPYAKNIWVAGRSPERCVSIGTPLGVNGLSTDNTIGLIDSRRPSMKLSSGSLVPSLQSTSCNLT